MKKKTMEQEINNSINAFFDNEEVGENKLSHIKNTSLLANEPKGISTEKADTLVKILKTVFLFLPGAFFLYFSSIFFLYAFFIGKTSFLEFGFGFLLSLISVFMIMFGIGKIKDSKYLLIPTSICAISFILFLVSLLLPETFQVKLLFEYSAYLFPLILITPFLTKSLIDKKKITRY